MKTARLGRRWLAALSGALLVTPAPAQKPIQFSIRVQAGRPVRTMRGGIGASFHAIEEPKPGQRPGGGVWAGSAAHLFVFAAPPKVMSVVVLASNPQTIGSTYGTPVQAFLDGLRFASAAEPAPARNVAPAPDGGSFSGGGLSGVWMGFKQLTMIGSVEPDARWITFFDDGQSMDTIPRQGLAGFDRRASKADPQEGPYWSTYRFSGGTGVINTRIPTKIRAESADKIKLDDLWYYNRCASVDGLRLEGSWTSYANPSDPALQRLTPGQRPILRFTRDGRFTDEGVFMAFLGSFGNRPDERAGSGTYEIRDFSLLLYYSDGRRKQVAFTGFMSANPATNDQMLYVGRGLFRKMR